MSTCCYYSDTFTSDARWGLLVLAAVVFLLLIVLFTRAVYLDRVRPGWRRAPKPIKRFRGKTWS
jgi:hypothetical protein